jgi:hypothetical protein
MSNHSITDVADWKINFRYKGYRHDGEAKMMALDALELIQRFAINVLPEGFVHIRH